VNTPRRHLTLFDAVCVIVGVIIGAGVYECAPAVASATSTPAGVVGFWVLGGLLSLCGALCYAELACAYPQAGGDYEYLTRAYGPPAGFLFGWFLVTLIRPGDIALLALVFARYGVAAAPDLFPGGHAGWWHQALAIGSVLVLTGINILGVRHGKRMQNTLTTIKVMSLLAIVLTAFIGARYLAPARPTADTHSDPAPLAASDVERETRDGSWTAGDGDRGTGADDTPDARLAGADGPGQSEVGDEEPGELAGAVVVGGATFGLAMIFVLFSYGGWNEMAFLAAEMEHPEKNILRGLVIGAVGVMSIYVLLNLAFLQALGLGGLARSQAVAVDAVAVALPTLGQSLISAAICISALGAVSGLIFTGSRIAYAIGRDYPLFSYLGQWHPESQTPIRALAVQAAVASLMIMVLGEFLEALIYTSAAVYCFFLASCLAVIVLRRKDPDVVRPYRVIGYPWTVLVFAGACSFLIYSAVTYRPLHGVALVGMLLLGCAVYWTQGPPRRGARGEGTPQSGDGEVDEKSHE
jgi:basic amino acid/polyamine antiporter, APA family